MGQRTSRVLHPLSPSPAPPPLPSPTATVAPSAASQLPQSRARLASSRDQATSGRKNRKLKLINTFRPVDLLQAKHLFLMFVLGDALSYRFRQLRRDEMRFSLAMLFDNRTQLTDVTELTQLLCLCYIATEAGTKVNHKQMMFHLSTWMQLHLLLSFTPLPMPVSPQSQSIDCLVLSRLPDDVLMMIFTFLDLNSIASLMSTCKKLRNVSLRPYVWNTLAANRATEAAKRKALETHTQLSTRHRHPLTCKVQPYRTGGFTCDNCHKMCGAGAESWNCLGCRFDLCETCFIPADAPYVPHPHPLVLGLPDYVSGRWHCDHCRTIRSITQLVRRCAPCNYDLCAPCWTQHLEANFNSPPSTEAVLSVSTASTLSRSALSTSDASTHSPSGSNANLRRGHQHPLARVICKEGGYTYGWHCDTCATNFSSDTPMWHCDHCSWDACEDCYRQYLSDDIAATSTDPRARFLFGLANQRMQIEAHPLATALPSLLLRAPRSLMSSGLLRNLANQAITVAEAKLPPRVLARPIWTFIPLVTALGWWPLVSRDCAHEQFGRELFVDERTCASAHVLCILFRLLLSGNLTEQDISPENVAPILAQLPKQVQLALTIVASSDLETEFTSKRVAFRVALRKGNLQTLPLLTITARHQELNPCGDNEWTDERADDLVSAVLRAWIELRCDPLPCLEVALSCRSYADQRDASSLMATLLTFTPPVVNEELSSLASKSRTGLSIPVSALASPELESMVNYVISIADETLKTAAMPEDAEDTPPHTP